MRPLGVEQRIHALDQRHRLPGRPHLHIGDLALPRDQRHRAGNLVRVDVVLDEGGDALEALRRHPDCFRFGERQIGLRRDRDEPGNDDGRESEQSAKPHRVLLEQLLA